MTKQNRGRKSLVLLLLVIVGLLLLISITGEGRGQLTPVEDLLLAVFAPVQTVFSSAGQRLQLLYDAVVSFHELQAENVRLREEIAFIDGQLIQLQELQKQNYRYREMLGFKESNSFELLPAEVIARDPSQWFGTITINRGYLDGVAREAPVITERGLVGLVTTVSPNSSQIILITDPRIAVSAMVLRSRDPGIVGLDGIVESYSRDPSFLKMSNLPPDTNIQSGDVIVTSGLGGVFPKGIFIGTVKGIADEPFTLVMSVVIEPRVNFNRLEEVFIVMGAGSHTPPHEENGEDEQ
jgi:rod shape-determining protein MreC